MFSICSERVIISLWMIWLLYFQNEENENLRRNRDECKHNFFFVRKKKWNSDGIQMLTIWVGTVTPYIQISKVNFQRYKPRIEKLKNSASSEHTQFSVMNQNELNTKASYLITQILACKMKLFIDAEVAKECSLDMCTQHIIFQFSKQRITE